MNLRIIAAIAILGLFLIAFSSAIAGNSDAASAGEIVLENGLVKAVFSQFGIWYSHEFYAMGKDGWVKVMEFAGPGSTIFGGRAITSVGEVKESGDEKYIDASGSSGTLSFSMRISLKPDEKWFKVTVDETSDPLGAGESLAPLTSYLFKPEGKSYSEIAPLDFTFTPQLKKVPLKNFVFGVALPSEIYADMLPTDAPQPRTVIGQHTFRAPATIVQEGNVMAAIIPDIDDLKSNFGYENANVTTELIEALNSLPTGFVTYWSPLASYFAPAMDYDITDPLANAPVLSYGWCRQTIQALWHTYYVLTPRLPSDPASYAYTYYVYLDADAAEKSGFEDVVDWQWGMYGRPYLEQSILPQVMSYDKYTNYTYQILYRGAWQCWIDFDIDGIPCGGVSINRESSPDFWFQGWFQHLRSAYGMYIYGEKLQNSSLVEKARKVLNLSLQSPNGDGPFHAIYSLPNKEWASSPLSAINGGAIAGGVDWGHDYYHTLDNSWTAYWMARWYEDLEKDPRILPYIQKYADALLGAQLPSGAIPSWLEKGTLAPHNVFLESAETATSMMFLAEIYKITGDAKYLSGAEKAAGFMISDIFPENKWFDFETFFSCAAKELDFYDDFTGQHPQNTLSMNWAAMGMKILYEITGNPTYLEYGKKAVDLLSLYQQIWDAPFLSINTFGGFSVMNTDAEWNDARQSNFAQTLFDYYDITGNPMYFERGIAAMRSSFMTMSCPENEAVAPTLYSKYGTLGIGDENYGHGGYDYPANYLSFDWGGGSASACAAMAWSRYGGLFVDMERGNAFGLDGCIVKNTNQEGGSVSFTAVPMLPEAYNLSVVVKAPNVDNLKITVNGERIKNIEILDDSRLRFTIELNGENDFDVESVKAGSSIIPGFECLALISGLAIAIALAQRRK